MPWNASNLSNPKYGYDFVVATTQASINGTMLTFMSSRKKPVVSICYVVDQTGTLQPIEYEELLKRTDGVDPFKIPDNADPAHNSDLAKVRAARFKVGFRARIGIPPGLLPKDLPDVVVLGADTGSVGFNLLCSEFSVAQYVPASEYDPARWSLVSQPKGSAWTFKTKVDLRLSNTDSTAYGTLPAHIQEQILNMSGTAFSVQQLLFDMSNASLMTTPTIDGIAPGSTAYSLLQQYFVGAYFVQLQKEGRPLLGCAVVPHTAPAATMTLTNMNLQVCPFVDSVGQPIARPTPDEQKLSTLNYLCAADNSNLPLPAQFPWNWLEPNEVGDHDGIVSINRKTLAGYFRTKLDRYVNTSCILPSVTVAVHGGNVRFSWSLQKGQTPVTTITDSGPTVLKYNFSKLSEDRAGVKGALGAMKLCCEFDLTVDFIGTEIIVAQHLKVYLYLKSLATTGSGNIVDKYITDTYTIGINAEGRLEATKKTTRDDKSVDVKTNGFENFFTDFNKISDAVHKHVGEFATTDLEDIPLSTVQNYVFPGGQTFIFKHATFADSGDLVTFISYADPNKPWSVPLEYNGILTL